MSNTRKTTPKKATSRAKPATAEPPDMDALLGEDERAEDVVPICLRGKLLAEWNQLKAKYDAGPGDDDRAMLHDRAAKQRVAERMAEVEKQMRAGTVEFRLRALPRRRTPGIPKEQVTWQELVEAHPPRKDEQGKVHPHDAAMQVNRSTFLDALVHVSVVEPELTDDQWTKLDAKLNDAQFERLFWAAWQLNRAEVDVPFSRAVSMMRTLGTGSRRRSDSESPSDGSKAGNPSTSLSTSTATTDE